ncbi:MAG: hypothetical protein A2103_00990 [Gammaproteobacteria bacterium GWF2_41_13]|nr:MAG: hypothetical protein A2103_00990 [Gammaproteobacteria bacterium GWF2_41_13]
MNNLNDKISRELLDKVALSDTNTPSNEIPKELLDKVALSDMDATFELGNILFRRKDYHLARLCFFIVSEHGNGNKEAKLLLDEINCLFASHLIDDKTEKREQTVKEPAKEEK